MRRSIVGLLLLLAVPVGACRAPITLHAPQIAPSEARDHAARVDFAPIVEKPGAVAPFASDLRPPPPAVVLTSGIAAELRGRALRDADGSAYVVTCALDRFAIRTQTDVAATHTLATLYVDLACEARRAHERTPVWRGELRARSAATASSVLSTDTGLLQRMIDRMTADASRELASDLAVRALGLAAQPSARVFADQTVQQELSGIDDTPYGAPALAENPAAVAQAIAATQSSDAVARASAWNVAAMAAGPGDPWLGSDKLHLDDDPLVRFFQYKTLARLGTKTSMDEMRGALAHEEEPLLVELLKDAIASGGIGLRRTAR
jgi:hypothetical protein